MVYDLPKVGVPGLDTFSQNMSGGLVLPFNCTVGVSGVGDSYL